MEKAGVSAYRLSKETGIPQSGISQYKSGKVVPGIDKIEKIADYFGVSPDYLLGGSDDKNKPIATEDDELTEYLEELKNRPEMRMLFSLAKGATKEDVEQAVAIIEALRKTKNE